MTCARLILQKKILSAKANEWIKEHLRGISTLIHTNQAISHIVILSYS